MRTLLLIMLVAAGLAGCVTEDGTGSASIYVKDAATNEFDEIHVVFTKVSIHGAGNGSDNGTGWITVWENETGQDIDLLDLSGDRAAFLGEADLAAGKYTQIRIQATEAYGMQNGSRIDITLSNPTLKVVKSFDVEAGEESRIVIDFDLDRSVKEQGKNGWRMTPVIGKTTVTIVDDASSGEDSLEEGEATELEELQ